jgi:RNA polymerase sigma-70 factor (ECF subfamily)
MERLPELMRRYQAGDRDGADELVRLLNPLLARFYYSLGGDARQVEDLLQECWLRLHRARSTYRPGEPVLPWVLAIARHTRVDEYRRWRRSAGRESAMEEVYSHPSSDPRGEMENRLAASTVLAALGKIPEGQREVILMLKLGDMSIDEVARATGSTATAVKQKAYRAYQAVRRALGAKEELHELR